MTDNHVCGWTIEDEYTSVEVTEQGDVIFQVVKVNQKEEAGYRSGAKEGELARLHERNGDTPKAYRESSTAFSPILLMKVHLSAKEASMLSSGLAMAVAQLGEKGSKGALQPPTPPLESLITEELGAKN